MANIKKSFNFRNGVQVDSDNLLVTSTGLVGIGTTVPTEALDVRGNVSISGLTSTSEATIGVLTVTSVKPTEIIGAGVSIKSGIITSSGGGVVTFFGDGSNLTNLPTSQFSTVGGGSTNVFVIPNVGIATTNPSFNLQIGNDVDSGGKGVGINSLGDVKASGIITATTFVGALSGNATGLSGTPNISVGTISGSTATFSGAVGINSSTPNKQLDVIGDAGILVASTTNGGISSTSGISIFLSDNRDDGTNIDLDQKGEINYKHTDIQTPEQDYSDVFTFKSNNNDLAVNVEGTLLVGVTTSNQGGRVGIGTSIPAANLDVAGNSKFAGVLDVDGHTNLDNVSVAGVTTFTGHTNINNLSVAGVSTFVGEAQFNTGLIPDTDQGAYLGTNANSWSSLFVDSIGIDANVIQALSGELILNSSNDSVILKYANTTNKLATSGVGVTVFNQLDTTNIVASGVITATTELNSPLIGVGTDAPANDIQVRKSGNTEIQVTSDTGSAGLTIGRESGTNNTNNAEFRYGLASGGAPYSSAQSLDILNYGTGNFNYHISANNAGAIAGDFHWHKGVNNTLMTLTGIGGSLGIGITSPSEELHVIGGAIISGNLTANNLIGNLNGTLTGDVNITSGISTFKDLKVTGITTIGSGNETVFVNELGEVGIKTTSSLSGVTINASQVNASIGAVAIGATVLKSAVDFADAGNLSKRFMIPPKVGAAQTASLSGLVSGAMIYNTNLNKLQVYNGTNWETITSVEVTG